MNILEECPNANDRQKHLLLDAQSKWEKQISEIEPWPNSNDGGWILCSRKADKPYILAFRELKEAVKKIMGES